MTVRRAGWLWLSILVFTALAAQTPASHSTVRDSPGQPLSTGRVSMRSQTGIVGGWFGSTTSSLSQAANFTLANVAPGEYLLDVRPNLSSAAAGGRPTMNEFATVPLTVSGEDVDLAITTTPGISVSGRVVFEGGSDIARPNLRISAASEEDARNFVTYFGGDGSAVDEEGRFHIPSAFGPVLFRTSALPLNVMLKAVILNGVDITNTPFDATASDDVADLRIVLVDKQGRISGYVRNAQGEIQYNYRLVLYPTHLKEGRRYSPFPAQHESQRQRSIQRRAHASGRIYRPGGQRGTAGRGMGPGATQTD